MNADRGTAQDEEILQHLRAMAEPKLDAHIEVRMRAAVLERISQERGFCCWLFRTWWRPVVAASLPFATGLAFGHSEYLGQAPPFLELETALELATSIDAAHNLLEMYLTEYETSNVD